jgi:hypothetical protein
MKFSMSFSLAVPSWMLEPALEVRRVAAEVRGHDLINLAVRRPLSDWEGGPELGHQQSEGQDAEPEHPRLSHWSVLLRRVCGLPPTVATQQQTGEPRSRIVTHGFQLGLLGSTTT